MKKIAKIYISLLVFLMLIIPFASRAALVTCGVKDAGVLAVHPEYARTCDFTAFMDLINNGIRFILFDLAIPIAAISFAYAGFKMVTSGGSTEARGTAKSVATNTVYGLVFVSGAWLIIRTILTVLGYDGAWIGF